MADIHRGIVFTSDKWVYGTLAVFTSGLNVITDDKGKEWRIKPETKGKYVGFNDRQGKMIFAGDILESVQGSVFEVQWSEFYNQWEIECTAGTTLGVFDLKPFMAPNLWVEGNIYDN